MLAVMAFNTAVVYTGGTLQLLTKIRKWNVEERKKQQQKNRSFYNHEPKIT